jgi:hypothetical protein
MLLCPRSIVFSFVDRLHVAATSFVRDAAFWIMLLASMASWATKFPAYIRQLT